MTHPGAIRIGTAGWAIPPAVAPLLPADGSSLARYASGFGGTEINSTFKRAHRATTFARWAETVPDGFRFSVKLPSDITHKLRLQGADPALDAFMASLEPLGVKLGPLLVQLPPSLGFDEPIADAFFATASRLTSASLVCEPRHPSWFSPAAEALLCRYGVARVAADPAPVPAAAEPGGYAGLTYLRLHGSPRMYYSNYDNAALEAVARLLLASPAAEAWCIFDNTASGAALSDALRLRELIAVRRD